MKSALVGIGDECAFHVVKGIGTGIGTHTIGQQASKKILKKKLDLKSTSSIILIL